MERQNPDGSWGERHELYNTTVYALLAFLHHGHTPEDKEFGKAVEAGFHWLMEARATSVQDQLLGIHLFSGSCAMLAEPPTHKEQLARLIKELPKQAPPQPYRDLLSLTWLPTDIPRPGWTTTPADALLHLRHEPDDRIIRSADDFLKVSLMAIARLYHCTDCAGKLRRNTIDPLLEKQNRDGSFIVPGEPPLRSTAQFVMIACVYYRYFGGLLPYVHESEYLLARINHPSPAHR